MSSQKEMQWPHSIPRLTSQRLVLRALTVDDCEDYFLLNSDVKVMETYGVSAHKKKAETLNLIRFLQKQFRARAFLRWGIFQAHTGKLIGDIGFWRFVELRARGEIGIKLASEVWGQGFGTEALTAVIDFAFRKLNLQSIEANVDTENLGSISMFKKVDFIQVGTIPRNSYSEPTHSYMDTILLHMDADLWFKVHGRKKKRPPR
jgi:ribosomal-protein-alanine N-acetyltransferase